MRRALGFAIVTIVALITLACGGTSFNHVTRSQTVGPTTATVTLRLTAPNARVADASINEIQLTGLAPDGRTVFGPERQARAAELSFAVPVSATRLIFEFLAQGQVVGIYSLPTSLVAGQTLVITDPDFLDGASPLTGLQVLSKRNTYPRDFLPRVTARGTFADGSTADLTGSVTWTLASGTGQISPEGLITPSGAGPLSARASLQELSDELGLTITSARLSGLRLSPATLRLAAATSARVVALGSFDDGSELELSYGVSWSSSLSAIASVDEEGIVRGQTPGLTAITASYLTRTASLEVNVTTASLSRLEVTPVESSVLVGEGATFEATGHFSDQSQQDLTEFVTWGSNRPAVAIVDDRGRASALSAGQAQIIANDPETGMMASGTLTVSEPPDLTPVATSLAFTAQPPSPLNETQTFAVTVTVMDQFGQPFAGPTGDITLTMSPAPSLTLFQSIGEPTPTPTPDNSGITEGSTSNGSTTEGSASNGSTTEGSTSNGSTTEGSASNGSTTEGSASNGSTTEGSASGSTTPTPTPTPDPGLYGTLSRPLVNGVASFDGLSVIGPGTFVLNASLSPLEPGTSNLFTVVRP